MFTSVKIVVDNLWMTHGRRNDSQFQFSKDVHILFWYDNSTLQKFYCQSVILVYFLSMNVYLQLKNKISIYNDGQGSRVNGSVNEKFIILYFQPPYHFYRC